MLCNDIKANSPHLLVMTLCGTIGYLPAALRQILLLVLLSGTMVLFIAEMQYSQNAKVKILVSFA